jgi:hypothetical protein
MCKLVTDSTETLDEDSNLIDQEIFYQNDNYCDQITPDSWYVDIKYFMVHGTTPQHMDMGKRRALRLKSVHFHLINNVLFRKKKLMDLSYIVWI